MKKVIIVRGLPGSGKSTVAAQLAGKEGCAIAADDYPGLYEGGRYQAHLQAASHAWCMEQFELALQAGRTPIVLHNTFAQKHYLRPYIEAALNVGYSVQSLHSEKIWLPKGEVRSIHNVPESVSASMAQNWEPINEKREIISKQDIADTIAFILKNPHHVPLVLADMDNTVKLTKSGEVFPQSPDDAILNPEFVSGMRSLLRVDSLVKVIVLSNQAGIAGGQKKEDFLDKEIEYLDGLLEREFGESPVSTFQCAPSKKGCKIRRYVPFYGISPKPPAIGRLKISEPEVEKETYKPSTGMVAGTGINLDLTKPNIIWMIGDSDTSDGGFAKNLQAEYPNVKVLYIPIEFFASVAQMHVQNY
jgi:histidinol phosphatase-like enzyme/predicted kinase